MGRLIDADILREEVYSWGMNDYEPSDFIDAIDDAPTVEAIPKADYEARLKADMVAMLKEIQKEIEEKIQGYEARSLEHINAMYEASMCGRILGCCGDNEIIQERIDKLKGVGMTIDELKDYVEEQRSLCNIPYHVYSTLIDELDLMAETLYKYQKIQKIVNSKTTRLSYDLGFKQIKEVIENETMA